jgi:hypothetical protein
MRGGNQTLAVRAFAAHAEIEDMQAWAEEAPPARREELERDLALCAALRTRGWVTWPRN